VSCAPSCSTVNPVGLASLFWHRSAAVLQLARDGPQRARKQLASASLRPVTCRWPQDETYETLIQIAIMESLGSNWENWRWEYEDGLPGSGDWRPVDETMERQLSLQLLKRETQFMITVASTVSNIQPEYAVDLLRMEQTRVDTGAVRGLRMSNEAEMISHLCKLEPCQRAALAYITAMAKTSHEGALALLVARCKRLTFSEEQVMTTLAYFRNTVKLIIHVKKELLIDPTTLGGDTHYRSQFETHTSNGLLDRQRRAEWERDLFGGAYDVCEPAHRPKYGVANVVNDPRGIARCEHYGTCLLELSPAVRRRCTFSGADSGRREDFQLATCNYYAHVLLNDYTDGELGSIIFVATQSIACLDSRSINNYKEVQIHGPVALSSDVVAVHVPSNVSPSERRDLQSFAERNHLSYIEFDPARMFLHIAGVHVRAGAHVRARARAGPVTCHRSKMSRWSLTVCCLLDAGSGASRGVGMFGASDPRV
jgi:hypothetical protein